MLLLMKIDLFPGLSPSLQMAMNQSAIDIGATSVDDVIIENDDHDHNWLDLDDSDSDSEELELSHEGGEYTDTYEAILEDIVPVKYVVSLSLIFVKSHYF